MNLTIWGGAARIASAAGILLLGLAANVHAAEIYWHGVRSASWNHGIDPNTNLSNWYSEAPPNGDPRNVPNPDDTAIFEDGAVRLNILVAQDATIGRMRFAPDAPRYTFRLARNKELEINGQGIVNQSNSVPRFTLLKHSFMTFSGAARLVSAGAAKSASVEVIDGATLLFRDSSKGGDAIVANNAGNSLTLFTDESSAEKAAITNRPGGRTAFVRRSTGGNASFENQRRGKLQFGTTRGPNADGNVTAREIANDGILEIGPTILTLSGNFTQSANASLAMQVGEGGGEDGRANRARLGGGRLIVRGQTQLGGDLIVTGNRDIRTGQHLLVDARGGRTGRFARAEFVGFDPDLRARIAYSSKEVMLIVERK